MLFFFLLDVLGESKIVMSLNSYRQLESNGGELGVKTREQLVSCFSRILVRNLSAVIIGCALSNRETNALGLFHEKLDSKEALSHVAR